MSLFWLSPHTENKRKQYDTKQHHCGEEFRFLFLLDMKSRTKNLLTLHRIDPNFNSICDQSKKMLELITVAGQNIRIDFNVFECTGFES